MILYYTQTNGKYLYILNAPFTIKTGIKPAIDISHRYFSFSPNSVLVISKGYAWDGASGPIINTENLVAPSLVHDVLYQMVESKLLPKKYLKEIDKLFYKLCRQEGMSRVRSIILYIGLRIFSKFKWGIRA